MSASTNESDAHNTVHIKYQQMDFKGMTTFDSVENLQDQQYEKLQDEQVENLPSEQDESLQVRRYLKQS